MSDQLLSPLVEVLMSKCDSIKTFGLTCFHEITIVGWLALSAGFLTPMCVLQFILMGNENFDKMQWLHLQLHFVTAIPNVSQTSVQIIGTHNNL